MEIIREKDLLAPTELLKLNVDELEKYAQEVKKTSKKIGYEIGSLKRQKEHDSVPAKEQEKKTIDSYGETVKDVINFKKFYSSEEVKGKGLQPKRNAYKIQDGVYGGLVIDVPKLFNEMCLNVFWGGELIYDANADKSLIDLITKRFNPKTKYSMNAVKIFNDLNLLSNLPKHRSSGKSRMVGSSVTYYNNANELADRMKILIGSIAAGNNSPVIRNDLSQINDELLRINAIDKSLHEKFYQKYLS